MKENKTRIIKPRKWRLVFKLTKFDYYECLMCGGEYDLRYPPDDWKYCPLCGEKFDSEPELKCRPRDCPRWLWNLYGENLFYPGTHDVRWDDLPDYSRAGKFTATHRWRIQSRKLGSRKKFKEIQSRDNCSAHRIFTHIKSLSETAEIFTNKKREYRVKIKGHKWVYIK